MSKLSILNLISDCEFIEDLSEEQLAQSIIGGDTAAISFGAARYSQIGSTVEELSITGSAAITSRDPIDVYAFVSPNFGFVGARRR